jgi:hypothetical protein
VVANAITDEFAEVHFDRCLVPPEHSRQARRIDDEPPGVPVRIQADIQAQPEGRVGQQRQRFGDFPAGGKPPGRLFETAFPRSPPEPWPALPAVIPSSIFHVGPRGPWHTSSGPRTSGGNSILARTAAPGKHQKKWSSGGTPRLTRSETPAPACRSAAGSKRRRRSRSRHCSRDNRFSTRRAR